MLLGFFTQTSREYSQSLMLRGVSRAAQENKFDLIRFTSEGHFLGKLHNYNLDSQYDVNTQFMNLCKIDGLVFLGWLSPEVFLPHHINQKSNLPILSLGSKRDPYPSVYLNGANHILELMNHLIIKHGYRRIAFADAYYTDDRFSAYQEKMHQFGLWDPALYLDPQTLTYKGKMLDFELRSQAIVQALLARSPTLPEVIMCLYTTEAYLLIAELKKRGLRVPEDIAVSSWEDADLGKYNQPSITSIPYPWEEIGYTGTNLIISQIQGHAIPLHTEVHSKVSYRQSCGCQANLEPLLSQPPTKVQQAKFATNDFKSLADLFGFQDAIIKEIATIPTEPSHVKSLLDSILQVHTQLMADLGMQKTQQNILNENISKLGHDIVSSVSLKTLFTNINTALEELSIPFCQIYLPDSYNAKSATIKLSFWRAENNRQKLTKLNQTICPENLALGDRQKYPSGIVLDFHLLHVHQDFLGLMVIGQGPEDERINHTLAVFISAALRTIQIMQHQKQTNAHLKISQQSMVEKNRIIKDRTAELEEMNLKLSTLDSVKNDFIANITHDFRSPLTVTLGTSELGMLDSEKDSDVFKQFRVIYDASIKLKSTVDRFLDLARMEASGLKIKARPVQIKALLNELTEFYQSSLLKSNIRILSLFPPGEVQDFHTDMDKLEEILSNLISNALKYVDHETGKIFIELVDGETAIEIRVRDNGIGIPKDKLETIFDRFTQLDSANASKQRGTGIGLSFCRQLAVYLKSDLKAESSGEGQGSVFILTMPKGHEHFDPQDWQADSSTIIQSETRRSEMRNLLEQDILEHNQNEIQLVLTSPNLPNEYNPKKALILLIEDNRAIRNIEIQYLRNAGYQNFVLASDGKQALDAAYQYRPDLIICDITMPHLRGDQFHQILTSNPEFTRTPFIFVSAVTQREIAIDLRKRGAVAFIGKPIDATDFILTIDLHLNRTFEQKRLSHDAQFDELTGLRNRRDIGTNIRTMLQQRIYRDHSLIFIDIDHFKHCNDTYGHPLGDKVLMAFGHAIHAALRPTDFAGRYGGEEFLVFLPDTTIQGAWVVAQKLQQAIKTIQIAHQDQHIGLSASFGLASLKYFEERIRQLGKLPPFSEIFEPAFKTDQNWKEIEAFKLRIGELLIELADRGLYQAKRSYCKDCGYASEKTALFVDQQCPSCASKNIVHGRNKIAMENTDSPPFQT